MQLWLIAVQVPLLAIGSLFALTHIFTRVSRDYGEGWAAYWARVAVDTPNQLYSLSHGMVSNNYPPAYFLLTGYFGRIFGDPLIVGRIVATGGLVATAGLCGAAVWRLGRSARWATMAGLLVLGYAVFPFSNFFGVSNPQWLAEALIVLAILPLLGERVTFGALLLSAAALSSALMIKHNVLAWPIAVTVWLALRDRVAMFRWLASGVAIGIVATATFYIVFGPTVFGAILGYHRTIDLAGGRDGLVDTLVFSPLLIAAWAGWRAYGRDPRWRLLGLYTAIATMMGLVEHLGAGVIDNAHFEAIVAAITLGCASLGRVRGGRSDPPIGGKVVDRLNLLMLLPLLLSWPVTVRNSLRAAAREPAVERSYAALLADVRRAHGPVLCEDLALCFWAGKPMTLDFFSYGQMLRTGADPAPLEAMIAARAPAIIVLTLRPQRGADHTRLPTPLPEMIHHYYAVKRTVPGYLAELVPITAAAAAEQSATAERNGWTTPASAPLAAETVRRCRACRR